MQWKGRRGSSNVEDRRGFGGGGGGGGGKLIGGGIGGIVIVLLVVLLGGNPGALLDGITGTGGVSQTPYEPSAQEQELAEFVSVVLADTEDVWTGIFRDQGMTYEEPTLVLYTARVQSACGEAGSSAGPFYCPGDHKLYIDLSFYDELRTQFKAPGDFAMAYVIAHEVGHHVQTLLGASEELNRQRQSLGEEAFNKKLVQFELQADYLSGVWAHHAEGLELLDEGDLEEALTAASAVGDDTIQKRTQGYIVPESFTHGTSAQRKDAFNRGYESGQLEDGGAFPLTG